MHLAIDIGGTTTRIARFSSIGSLKPEQIRSFATDYCYQGQLSAIRASVSDITKGKIRSVGVSFGVGLSPNGRDILAAGKMPDYIKKPFVRDLSVVLGADVRVAHDCVCALLAHEYHRSARNVRCFAYVTVSTGIGAAVALRTEKTIMVLRSRLAHQIVEPSGLMCKCGQRGCLAAYCDSTQLEVHTLSNKHDRTQDCGAFARHLAHGMVSFSWMFPIEVIFVAGGFFERNPQLFRSVQTAFRLLRVEGDYQRCVLRRSPLENYAPLIGANLLRGDQQVTIFN